MSGKANNKENTHKTLEKKHSSAVLADMRKGQESGTALVHSTARAMRGTYAAAIDAVSATNGHPLTGTVVMVTKGQSAHCRKEVRCIRMQSSPKSYRLMHLQMECDA